MINVWGCDYMREIKFRGQRTDTKEWVYGYLIYKVVPREGFYEVMTRAYLIQSDDCPHDIYEVIPETVGQYTGCRDEDRNDVYEGDKYKVPNGDICIIEYIDNAFIAVPINPKYEINRYDHWGNTEGEVIGNIHEGE